MESTIWFNCAKYQTDNLMCSFQVDSMQLKLKNWRLTMFIDIVIWRLPEIWPWEQVLQKGWTVFRSMNKSLLTLCILNLIWMLKQNEVSFDGSHFDTIALLECNTSSLCPLASTLSPAVSHSLTTTYYKFASSLWCNGKCCTECSPKFALHFPHMELVSVAKVNHMWTWCRLGTHYALCVQEEQTVLVECLHSSYFAGKYFLADFIYWLQLACSLV